MKAEFWLGKLRDPRAIKPLTDLLKDPDDGIWAGAADAVAELVIGSGADAMIPLLRDPNPRIRRGAARAIGADFSLSTRSLDAGLANALLNELREHDLDVIGQTYLIFIHWGEPNSEDELIEALQEFGDKDMAVDYLHCGNRKLEDAGYAWLYARFQINDLTGDHFGWGSEPLKHTGGPK
jgi:HEAT repeat protein